MEKTTPEALAEAYVWWLTPEETLRTPEKILRQILKMGTLSDYRKALELWGEQAFKDAMMTAPPGALDERSWNFWRRYFQLEEKAFPKRRVG